jgi:hypothetical protein
MTGAAWTADELDRIGGADELEIAPRRRDGSLRRSVPIWVVGVGEELYIRSWRGDTGIWYRTARSTHQGHISAGGIDCDVSLVEVGDDVDEAVDAAYRAKYGRYSSYVEPMIAPKARATTLKLVPRGTDEQYARPPTPDPGEP